MEYIIKKVIKYGFVNLIKLRKNSRLKKYSVLCINLVNFEMPRTYFNANKL